LLADLVQDADPKQFTVLFPLLEAHRKEVMAALCETVATPVDLEKTETNKESLARRQANAAIILLRMGQAEVVWPLLKHPFHPRAQAYGFSDPRVRSYLIHRFAPLGVDATALITRLREEPDITIRRALILSLGEYSERELSPDSRKALLPELQAVYCTEADSGLHAAAEWLLQKWNQAAWLKRINDEWAKDGNQRNKRLEHIRQSLAKDKAKNHAQWFVNPQGQTMVVIPGPVEFVMGAPMMEVARNDPELQHRKRIGRTFALASNLVTVEQYRQFDKPFQAAPKYTRLPDLPMGHVSWYLAARYCNWLSEREGIAPEQWCFEINGKEIKLKPNYLRLSGYRLPTEAEIEDATRAEAVTAWCFGETDELLVKYAWYDKNSQEMTWPVWSLKPNDFGLFDVHGNVHTWCQESLKDYPTPQAEEIFEDTEDVLSIDPVTYRVMRGGTFYDHASICRSAKRDWNLPSNRYSNVGFRPARTFTP
jgi:formylglycine-generating enzyme required for sulfatase activity